jgi:hypothetical protein
MSFMGAEPDAQGRYPRWVYATIAGHPDDEENHHKGHNRGAFTKEEREVLYGSPKICKRWGHSFSRGTWGTCLRCGFKRVYGTPQIGGSKRHRRPPMRTRGRKKPARSQYPHS